MVIILTDTKSSIRVKPRLNLTASPDFKEFPLLFFSDEERLSALVLNFYRLWILNQPKIKFVWREFFLPNRLWKSRLGRTAESDAQAEQTQCPTLPDSSRIFLFLWPVPAS